MKKISLSYIVPVYNEEEIIESTLNIFIKDFERLPELIGEYEIIVVDDHSADGTAEIVRRMVAKNGRIRMVRHKKNLGAGTAIRTGINASRMEWISLNCADRPFHTSDLHKIAHLFENNDVIVLCRPDRSANNWYRKLTSIGNYALIKLILRSSIHDFQFAQFYRRSILDQMSLVTWGTLVTAEMILRSERMKARMVEAYLQFHRRPGGRAKYGHPKHIIVTLLEIAKLRLCFWRERFLGKRNVISKRNVEKEYI